MRPHKFETPLMPSPDVGINCLNCWYYSPRWCDRRERTARWNPVLFVCSDFGAKDDKVTMDTTLGDWGVKG